ncbi:D-glycero-beta-D-manno-heptose 1-phosphate adenylyltransferase [Flavihumibacter fluvii]|jgi:D-glycero-beta-D-manno-heptose 1-phosphate adenylyltransferase|uniref:D-glycero-beta-D-manno-heptose 1-phosphate adenylyltransferase n=1 Tax=Flavihumibacter fluvii TaxID=2838157 RepID=UPI001BDDCFCE|nr:D-glycero-beta-D-manno-heptose 1-phosphate adenylyltransferase [Flavihumibacter fluvii]ULQ54277.1 D-glycero-beta-D-manno-heptose 1-phosphate adenylyltransferase [Flavihumibacter fluvii]
MRNAAIIPKKIYSLNGLKHAVEVWKFLGKKIVFTNGVFDILHQGHIYSLSQAAQEGDVLIVGVNADNSVKRLNKGPERPINDENSRALLLASLLMVDAVIIFQEDTPYDLITMIMPDVLVKGGDYRVEQVVGHQEVLANGGQVIINPIVEGFSTTGLISRMRDTK